MRSSGILDVFRNKFFSSPILFPREHWKLAISSLGQTTRSITIGKLNDNDVSTSESWGRVSLIGNLVWYFACSRKDAEIDSGLFARSNVTGYIISSCIPRNFFLFPPFFPPFFPFSQRYIYTDRRDRLFLLIVNCSKDDLFHRQRETESTMLFC